MPFGHSLNHQQLSTSTYGMTQPQMSYGHQQPQSAVNQLLSSQPTSSAYQAQLASSGLAGLTVLQGNPNTALVLTSCQHLTPQQQAMYQQQMQLQHQQQHLKKIRRNLPGGETSQLQQMRAKVVSGIKNLKCAH